MRFKLPAIKAARTYTTVQTGYSGKSQGNITLNCVTGGADGGKSWDGGKGGNRGNYGRDERCGGRVGVAVVGGGGTITKK